MSYHTIPHANKRMSLLLESALDVFDPGGARLVSSEALVTNNILSEPPAIDVVTEYATHHDPPRSRSRARRFGCYSTGQISDLSGHTPMGRLPGLLGDDYPNTTA